MKKQTKPNIEEETIKSLRETIEMRWDAIVDIQQYCLEKMIIDNKEGDLSTASIYQEIINKIQETLECL